MSENIKQFFDIMLSFFPQLERRFKQNIEEYGELLETVVIEEVFVPEIVKLLAENKEVKLLENIFKYFESVSNSEDEDLKNTFSITVLEILGNDKNILQNAKRYMGVQTTKLQMEADRGLGRI